ncbi:hypothetical protein PMG71_21595 [Roseofilum sp. BLCC_M154]|uniref:Uncharacterized protein n=1 Tax=Roseofilum acuticapitatum BLCC-M154 TaxID=3022444 RepID=A0ABT7AYP5_9CYAN|nr:hypothetical protein [Roseofilum acuticapitatum]MDJ1172029.1 hypothetical protein [Roseofilum acuticapitatum BLCC-M154]
MADSIIQLLDELPADNLTVKMLNALDFIVPGEWENVIGCDRTIEVATRETDGDRIRAIKNKAIELYNDKSNGYQSAIWFYQTIDKADTALGAAAMANKVGEKIGFLGFLNKLTPKADTTQSVDLCLKLVVELIAYSKLNGLGILNPGQFVAELREHYQDASLMRMATLVAVDGLLPLGPDFLQKVHATLDNQGRSAFEGNPAFSAISGFIPGNDKFGFINDTFNAVEGWMDSLVSSAGLTPQGVFDRVGNFIDFSDDSLDFVAAFLDTATDYYCHTGIQTVSRKLFLDAAQEV